MKKISFLAAGLIFSATFAQQGLTVESNTAFTPVTNFGPSAVIVNQTTTGTSGIVSDMDSSGNYVASADDFDLTFPATKITKIEAYGFNNSMDLLDNLVGVNFYIIADGDWIPDGNDPATQNLYAFEMVLGDPGFTVTADGGTGYTFTLDLDAAGIVTALPAEKYWLSVVAVTSLGDITEGSTRWNWFQSLSSNGLEGHLIDPMDLFGAGATEWTPLSMLLDWTDLDLGMVIEGDETTMGVTDLNNVSFAVYPNPATNFVKVDMKNAEVKQMTVISMNGKVVASSNSSSVRVSELPAGVYAVKVVDTNNKVYTSKIVKK
ncbi:MAG: T9SS type A sorting domain-containing protein [Moheibacter sp.]